MNIKEEKKKLREKIWKLLEKNIVIPHQEFDTKVDYIISPNKIIKC